MGRVCLSGLLGLIVLTWMGGCAAPPSTARIEDIYRAYDRGDYSMAYRDARDLASTSSGPRALEAAYMAGMAAYQLGQASNAEYYLRYSSQSSDEKLATDSLVGLGLVYNLQGRYESGAQALLAAAPKLTGQHQANAYYYAGTSQQKMGQWSAARNSFSMARSLSSDPTFRQRVTDEMAVTGFTVQMGAYVSEANARKTGQDLASRIAGWGVGNPRIVPASDDRGRKLYLLQIGQFSTYSQAVNLRSRLGASSAIIVPLR